MEINPFLNTSGQDTGRYVNPPDAGYPAEHPEFNGRALTPAGTITERAVQGIDVYQKRRPPGDRPQGKGEDWTGRGKHERQ